MAVGDAWGELLGDGDLDATVRVTLRVLHDGLAVDLLLLNGAQDRVVHLERRAAQSRDAAERSNP